MERQENPQKKRGGFYPLREMLPYNHHLSVNVREPFVLRSYFIRDFTFTTLKGFRFPEPGGRWGEPFVLPGGVGGRAPHLKPYPGPGGWGLTPQNKSLVRRGSALGIFNNKLL